MPGETVVHRAQLHFTVYAWAAVWTFLAFVSFFASAAPVGALFLIIAFVSGANAYVISTTSEFAITDKRTIIKTGFVWRRTSELLLVKLESVGVDQGVLGRILNYGTITLAGTGGAREKFKHIADPMGFRRKVYEQIEAGRTSPHAHALTA